MFWSFESLYFGCPPPSPCAWVPVQRSPEPGQEVLGRIEPRAVEGLSRDPPECSAPCISLKITRCVADSCFAWTLRFSLPESLVFSHLLFEPLVLSTFLIKPPLVSVILTVESVTIRGNWNLSIPNAVSVIENYPMWTLDLKHILVYSIYFEDSPLSFGICSLIHDFFLALSPVPSCMLLESGNLVSCVSFLSFTVENVVGVHFRNYIWMGLTAQIPEPQVHLDRPFCLHKRETSPHVSLWCPELCSFSMI